MYKDKQDWIRVLSQESWTGIQNTMLIEGKNISVSYFYYAASEEFKKDRELNALNFEKTKNVFEVPEEMLDFDFVKSVFAIRKSSSVFDLPYEFKNNVEEKEFVAEVLIHIRKTTDTSNFSMNWTFEPGFWSDISFTKEIYSKNYEHITISIVKELNKSKDEESFCFLSTLIKERPYYFKYLSAKNKSRLSQEIVLDHVHEYGLKYLTKEQANNYEIIKKAFCNNQINYKNLDNKWKTPEFLKDLLNNKGMWTTSRNGLKTVHMSDLSEDLLQNREVIEACISYGENLLYFKQHEKYFYFDRDLKKKALETYPNISLLEDCLDDKEMIYHYLSILKKSYYSAYDINNQIKKIPQELFEDKQIMIKFLSLDKMDLAKAPDNVLSSLSVYSIDDVIDFIDITNEVYFHLSEDMKNNIEIINCYLSNRGYLEKVPEKTRLYIKDFSDNNEEILNILRSHALSEKLERTLDESQNVTHKKLKI